MFLAMENPYANSNRQIADIYNNLGQSMKNYVLATIIVIGIGILGSFFTATSSNVVVYSEELGRSIEYGLIVSPLAFTGIFDIVMVGVIVFLAIRYFQYLSNLKEAGNQLGDSNLQKSFQMEIGGLISAIIFGIIIVVSISPILMSIVDNPTSFAMNQLMSMISLILFGMFIIYVFQIIGVIYLDRWGQHLRHLELNFIANPIAQGISLMKWGRILNPILGGIGEILYLVGMMKSGKKLISYPSLENSGRVNNPIRNFNYPPSHSPYPNPNNQTYRPTQPIQTPSGRPDQFCSACGTKMSHPQSRFCENCGKKLL